MPPSLPPENIFFRFRKQNRPEPHCFSETPELFYEDIILKLNKKYIFFHIQTQTKTAIARFFQTPHLADTAINQNNEQENSPFHLHPIP